MNDLESTINAILGGRKPVDSETYRQHILTTQIFAALERWGFDSRFQKECQMPSAQRRTYEQMTSRMIGKGAIVALVGERGLGKTTITAQFAIKTAWANYDFSMGAPGRVQHVIYKKCAKIIARYKPLFADFGSTETEHLLESLEYLARQQEFLVIDELHECDDAKFKTRILTDLIDRRYAACRDTILIANQTGADFAMTIGDSILSRLSEHGAILECSWPSFRTQP